MRRETLLGGLTIAGVTAGLGVLLYGEAAHVDGLIPAGGVVVLLSVGLLTVYIDRL